MFVDPARVHVIAPSFKRRLSGVTATVVRLVPLQARAVAIAACGPGLPPELPQIRLRDLLRMAPEGPQGPRIWHARRNTEMIGGLVLRGLLGKRLRLVFTSASQRVHTRLTRALIARMDAVIATSARGAAYLERPAEIILHGIDAEAFQPPADRAGLRARLGLPVTGPLIGCYGRIRAQKGTDAFVEAMIAVLAAHPEAHAVVMGRATERHRGFLRGLKVRVAAAGLGGRLLFRPEVPVWDMAHWYQALDLFVAPQRWEGFGLTPLEAMACGVPVIATRVGAFEELLDDGVTGHLVTPGAPGEIARLAQGLLARPEAMARMGQAGRARVLARFRIEDEARAICAVYDRLTQGAGAGGPGRTGGPAAEAGR